MAHTASLLPDGRVLVVGGQASPLTAAPEASIYDPERNRWAPARKLASARYGHTATVTQTGTVFVFGATRHRIAPWPAVKSTTRRRDKWSDGERAADRTVICETLLPSGKRPDRGAGTAGVTLFGWRSPRPQLS